jgi:hypothetical protein
MKVKNLFTGIVSAERADIALALIRQGLCARVDVDPTASGGGKMPAPQWTVEIIKGFQNQDYLAIRFRQGSRDETYSGAPLELTARAFGREVPKSVAEDYARQWLASSELRKFFDRQTGPHPENELAAKELATANAVAKRGKCPRRSPFTELIIPVDFTE